VSPVLPEVERLRLRVRILHLTQERDELMAALAEALRWVPPGVQVATKALGTAPRSRTHD